MNVQIQILLDKLNQKSREILNTHINFSNLFSKLKVRQVSGIEFKKTQTPVYFPIEKFSRLSALSFYQVRIIPVLMAISAILDIYHDWQTGLGRL